MKFIGTLLFSAAFGATGKEAYAGGLVAAAGTAATMAMGGWDTAVKLLLILMLADYITGLLGALKNHNVNSDVMFWGGIRKGVVFGVVLIAVQLDHFAGNPAPIFRTAALYFYIGREGLSVVENLGIFGVTLPGGLKKFLEQLQQKSAEEDKSDGKGV